MDKGGAALNSDGSVTFSPTATGLRNTVRHAAAESSRTGSRSQPSGARVLTGVVRAQGGGGRGWRTYRSNHFADQDDGGPSGRAGRQDPATVQFKQEL